MNENKILKLIMLRANNVNFKVTFRRFHHNLKSPLPFYYKTQHFMIKIISLVPFLLIIKYTNVNTDPQFVQMLAFKMFFYLSIAIFPLCMRDILDFGSTWAEIRFDLIHIHIFYSLSVNLFLSISHSPC